MKRRKKGPKQTKTKQQRLEVSEDVRRQRQRRLQKQEELLFFRRPFNPLGFPDPVFDLIFDYEPATLNKLMHAEGGFRRLQRADVESGERKAVAKEIITSFSTLQFFLKLDPELVQTLDLHPPILRVAPNRKRSRKLMFNKEATACIDFTYIATKDWGGTCRWGENDWLFNVCKDELRRLLTERFQQVFGICVRVGGWFHSSKLSVPLSEIKGYSNLEIRHVLENLVVDWVL